MDKRDWVRWHDDYEDPSSSLSWRLACITGHIRAWLDSSPEGPLRLISVCAGQGRDVYGALQGHPRARDVSGRLVELDARNVAEAERRRCAAGITSVEVVHGDASSTSAYAGAVPANLVVLCGVLGNLRDGDVERTIQYLPTLCAEGATVIWTRHRKQPDLTPLVRQWFARAGFEQTFYAAPPVGSGGVGVHRLIRPPHPFETGVTLFEFVGFDNLASS